MSKGNVLLVDDDSDLLGVMESLFRVGDYAVITATSDEMAVRAVTENKIDVAVVDLAIPDGGGLSLVGRLRQNHPEIQIIIFTGYPSTESAIEAVRFQVSDYLCKPQDMGRTLLSAVDRALCSPLRGHVDAPAAQSDSERSPSVSGGGVKEHELLESSPQGTRVALIGETEIIKSVRSRIAEVAQSDLTVLIRGESGTGKSIAARMIHEASNGGNRASFVQINAPAVPDALMESELFGYEKGAFTGAERQKPGRLELAAGGTLFLDEIGSISPAMQSKLLEVIDTKQFMRVGGREALRLDVRFVGATNAPLEEMIRRGEFRMDLLYRLNQVSIYLPPLREHSADIPLLAEYFMHYYGQKYGRVPSPLPASILAELMTYEWPGNVRELEAVIARYVLTNNVGLIKETLAGRTGGKAHETKPQEFASLENIEKDAIQAALVKARWNQRKAAGLLGLSYSALRRRVAKFNLNTET
ncbi:MAG: sigma-54-dependent Fis family transcriptional regulator [Candidatus Hydrogenedentes bacterium]|nr:sigma-54-dependent Fis family transcriptional regulator [Candidatus Hydrogenedentota bacterium]